MSNLLTRFLAVLFLAVGLSGPAIKPVALRAVWQVCQAVSAPVIGVGGISSAEDVLEFILVGAHAVQIGTANFMRPDLAFRVAAELPGLKLEVSILTEPQPLVCSSPDEVLSMLRPGVDGEPL